MKVHRCGDRALLVEVDDIGAVLGLHAALTARRPAGVTELVPAARTLLVRFDPAQVEMGALSHRLRDTEPAPAAAEGVRRVDIPVVYDGDDLADIAQQARMDVDAVIETHTAAHYVVVFSGFAPGFGYLSGLDPRLHLPRRSSPRTKVPAGSIGIAGEFTGVYPRASPGGWQLLGHTGETLWDPDRDPPALLAPGTRVRFHAVDSSPLAGDDDEPAGRAAPMPGAQESGIEVVRPGALSTVQDLGRPGMAALGVSPSGAADRRSSALANRLVGNLATAACLELTLGGAALRFHRSVRVAVTGAPGALDRDGRGEAMNAPFDAHAGQVLTLGAPTAGVYTYVGVRGGVAVPPVLGSRAADLLSGLGPNVLAAGDRLPIGTDRNGPPPAIEVAPVRAISPDDLTLHVLPGPRHDWFTSDALETLGSGRYVVCAESNRIGVRLDGPVLTRARDGELLSEGIVSGAIQVPPSGQPVIFLADHPVTGGYPVIGVVRHEDLPSLAQARPGQGVRFRVIGAGRVAADAGAVAAAE